jgi:adenine deaminase
VRVIGVIENQAPTRALEAPAAVEGGVVEMDRPNDVCQIALVERHRGTGAGVQRLRLRLRLHAGLRDGLHGGA